MHGGKEQAGGARSKEQAFEKSATVVGDRKWRTYYSCINVYGDQCIACQVKCQPPRRPAVARTASGRRARGPRPQLAISLLLVAPITV